MQEEKPQNAAWHTGGGSHDLIFFLFSVVTRCILTCVLHSSVDILYKQEVDLDSMAGVLDKEIPGCAIWSSQSWGAWAVTAIQTPRKQ